MRMLAVLFAVVLLLSGCTVRQGYETMSDSFSEPEKSMAGEVSLLLPVGAEVVTAEHELNGKLWLCEEYWVCLRTSDAGDIEKTVLEMTGYNTEQLPVICVDSDGQKRYEFVWCSVGETGEQMNRGVIIDDGAYHYALTLHAEAESAGDLIDQWQNITATFAVSTVP